jgi:hypothetical protein
MITTAKPGGAERSLSAHADTVGATADHDADVPEKLIELRLR